MIIGPEGNHWEDIVDLFSMDMRENTNNGKWSLGYMRPQNLKSVALVILFLSLFLVCFPSEVKECQPWWLLETVPEVDEEKNKEAFTELIRFLDYKRLSLVMKDALDDGREALSILRNHYAGKGKPCIIDKISSSPKWPNFASDGCKIGLPHCPDWLWCLYGSSRSILKYILMSMKNLFTN